MSTVSALVLAAFPSFLPINLFWETKTKNKQCSMKNKNHKSTDRRRKKEEKKPCQLPGLGRLARNNWLSRIVSHCSFSQAN